MGTPASQLVDIMAAGVHRGAPSFGDGKALKRAYHAPTTTTSVASKGDEATLMEVPLPSDPSEVTTGISGSSMPLMTLHRGPHIPYNVP